ncbi:MAG: tetratricopeptide repeat protein [Acidobacteriota bacterium]
MPQRHLALLAFMLLLPAGCITITPRSQRVGSAATVIPNVPLQKWGIESCGAGSLSTVLQHYGEPTSMTTWDATLPKTRGGVMTIDILLAARQKGFDARLLTGDPATVSEELLAGRPVILMLQVVDYPGKHFDFFHYIVADGIDPARRLIRTQWGDRKPRWVSFPTLEEPWKGGGHAAIFIRPRSESDSITDQLRAAVTLEDQGKFADAASVYRQLLSQHPDSALAWTNLGNADMQLGKRGEAEQDFRKALAADPTARDAMNNLAWLLLHQQRLDEAEVLARKAVATSGPDSYLMLDTLARVLAAKGSCSEAASTFRQAIDAVPASSTAARDEIVKAKTAADSSCGRPVS